MAEASKVGARGVVSTVHHGGWMWLVDAMCLLDGEGLCHLLYVILYEDTYSNITCGTDGVKGICRDEICLQIPAY